MSQTLGPSTDLPPIDPFAPAPEGRYADGAVVVERRTVLPGSEGLLRGVGDPDGPNVEQWTVTRTFAVRRADGSGRGDRRLVVLHALPDTRIGGDLTGLLHRELVEPGWVSDADCFERVFTGVVLSSRPDPMDAWELFYRNSLRYVAENETDQFASIYRYAEELVAGVPSGSLLDLGSCFGFFPLRVRAGSLGRPMLVTASDVGPGTSALLDRISARIGLRLPVLRCDAAAVPMPSSAVDTVTSLHLLEHVDQAHGDRILAEALRLARRQVVVAVPLEAEAQACFDHVRTLTLAQLRATGEQLCPPGWRYRVQEHEGGWLVFSRSVDVG